MNKHPIEGGSRNTYSRLMLQEPELSAGLNNQLGSYQTLSIQCVRIIQLLNLHWFGTDLEGTTLFVVNNFIQRLDA